MTDEKLFDIVKRIDPKAVRLPPGIKYIAAEIEKAERESIISLAVELGWAMKNEDPFEDAVREICDMRKRTNAG